MSHLSNAELAAQFLAHLAASGLDVFRQKRPVPGAAGEHELLFIVPAGRPGENTSLDDAAKRVFDWANAAAHVPKSLPQAHNIAQVVWSLAPVRSA